MSVIGLDLALDILNERYGPVVAAVARAFFERGSLTLKELLAIVCNYKN